MNRHEQPLLRREYLRRHRSCALCSLRGRSVIACDPHHLCGRGWEGMDEAGNLLAVCRVCHDSVQGTRQGRVVSLYAKLLLGELDLGWLDEHGRGNWTGWVEVQAATHPDPRITTMCLRILLSKLDTATQINRS